MTNSLSDDTVHVAVLVQAAQPVGTREVVLATANKPTLETVQNTHSNL
ncbi:hypothetical protein [Xanthomonas sp. MUS 060]|nr:hypothetical protein [Xanthomonas sp. MUS 060]